MADHDWELCLCHALDLFGPSLVCAILVQDNRLNERNEEDQTTPDSMKVTEEDNRITHLPAFDFIESFLGMKMIVHYSTWKEPLAIVSGELLSDEELQHPSEHRNIHQDHTSDTTRKAIRMITNNMGFKKSERFHGRGREVCRKSDT